MPIRTHRGRAAVYRRIWGAPLRSPKHLIVTVVIMVALVTTVGFVVPKLLPGGDAPSPAASESETRWTHEDSGQSAFSPSESAPAEPSETRLTESPLSPTSAPAAPEAIVAATKWARAWVNHPAGTTSEKWLAGLAPYTTDEYLPVMESVEPKNIPASKVTGKAKVTHSTSSSVEAEVPTDGPKLLITVVKTHDGWRVAAYDQGA